VSEPEYGPVRGDELDRHIDIMHWSFAIPREDLVEFFARVGPEHVRVRRENGRVVAAVFFDQAKWLDFYRLQIETAAPFPPDLTPVDGPTPDGPIPAGFADAQYHTPTVVLSGHDPDEMRARVLLDDGRST